MSNVNTGQENVVLWFLGMFGGAVKYISAISLFGVPGIFARMAEAGMTAIVCGLLGLFSKDVYRWAKPKIVKFFKWAKENVL